MAKHLKLRKLKCIIISSNVERIKSAGKVVSSHSGLRTGSLVNLKVCM